ncbi:MAG: LacI family DNA-binding transcriptional regulator [Rhodospirillales bacterium]
MDDPNRTTNGPQRLTIADVAAAAGVSVVTVSRAMNAPDVVSERTRRRIADAMRAIGYVPDLMARALTTQRSGIVAALVPTLTDPGFARSMEGLINVLGRQGLQLIFGNTQYDSGTEERVASALLGRRPDALVLTGTTHTDAFRRVIAAAGIPVVEMWHLDDGPIDMAVGIRNRDASRDSVRHLSATGRRSLAYVGRPVRDNERAAARQQGFLAAAAEAGIVVPATHVIETATSMAVGAEVVERLVVPGVVDGIAFSGDDAAAGALMRCLALGIDVPGSLSIVGFGDHPIASLLPGGLSTVRIDGMEIGIHAANLILRALSGQPVARRVVDVGYQLILRGSTIGPPAT